MTSTVTARRLGLPLVEIMQAVFPPASITGAPKIRTMEIIRELEADPRGVYTGCDRLSLARPQRRSSTWPFAPWPSTAPAGEAEYGVGGGIVWDSGQGGRICRVPDEGRRADRRSPAVRTAGDAALRRPATAISCWKATSGGWPSRRSISLSPSIRPRCGDAWRSWPAASAAGAHRVRLRVGRQGRVAGGVHAAAGRAACAAFGSCGWPSGRSPPQRLPLPQDDLRGPSMKRPARRAAIATTSCSGTTRAGDRNDHRQSRGREAAGGW